MSDQTSRRSFFSRLSAGLAAFGAGAVTTQAQSATSATAARSATGAPFQPARHPEDDWYDSLPGKHRLFFDAISQAGTGEAIGFAANSFAANKSGYNLNDGDLAIVICLRHNATHFAYTDAIWAKYGAAMGADLKFDDPKTKKAPVINVYNTSGFGEALPNRNISLDQLAKRGVHYAVCGLATRRISGVIARATGGNIDEIFKELSSSLVANGHLVPAGVVAANRSQERGYSMLYVG